MSNTEKSSRQFKHRASIVEAISTLKRITRDSWDVMEAIEAREVDRLRLAYEAEKITKASLWEILEGYKHRHYRVSASSKRGVVLDETAEVVGQAVAKTDPVYQTHEQVHRGASRELWILEGFIRVYDKAEASRANVEQRLASGDALDSWLFQAMYEAAMKERHAELVRDTVTAFCDLGFTMSDALDRTRRMLKPRLQGSSGRGHLCGHDAQTEAEMEFKLAEGAPGWF